MPRPTKGQIYECRLARLLHHEGAFVRRTVDLQLQFGEPFTVTDVDVLAVQFSPSLESHVLVVECKTTETRSAPSAADRLLWGTGVRRLVPGADRHMLATVKQASPRIRGLAARLGAEVVDERDVSRREALLGLSADDLSGPHDPALIAAQTEVFQTIKTDDDLRRVWGFVRSEFWFSDEVFGLKRAFGALRLLERRWHPELPDRAKRAVRWLAEESISSAVVSLVRMAGDCYRQPPAVFERALAERLAEGAVPYAIMQEISKEVDRYVMAVLQEAGVDPGRQLDRLGALDPRPPAYIEPLTEVLERLALAPRTTSQLARILDERIADRRGSPVPTTAPVIPEADRAAVLLETIAAFLRGQIKVPEALLSPLVTPRDPRRHGNAAPTDTHSDGKAGGTRNDNLTTASADRRAAAEKRAAPIEEPAAHGLIVDPSTTTLAESREDGDDLPRRTLRVGLRNETKGELAVVGAAGRSDALGALIADEGLSLAPGSAGYVTLPITQEVEGEALDTEVTLELAIRFRVGATASNSELRVRMRGALTTDRWRVLAPDSKSG